MKKLHQLMGLGIVLITLPVTSQINLNNVKGNVNLNKKEKNESGSESNSTNDKNALGGMTCEELVAKADALYDADNYTEAMKYYNEAEAKNCVGQMDGESRMKMNKCKDEVNATEEEKKLLNGIYTNTETEGGIDDMLGTGPKKKRPLKEEEKGKIMINPAAFVVGKSDLIAEISIPQPLQYYDILWCNSESCDYDHAVVYFYIELDGKYLTSWGIKMWDAAYLEQKQFSYILCTSSDLGFGDYEAAFNQGQLEDEQGNKSVYALFDKFYSKLSAGEHKITMKVLSGQSMKGPDYEASETYFNQFEAVAQGSITFNYTEADKSALMAKSVSKKLTHQGGEWTSVETHLKLHNTEGEATIIDVAVTTEWKVYKNSYGVILYRLCNADMLYKNKEGYYRYLKSCEVREDYGTSYGKPYFTEILYNYFTANSGFLSDFNYPVAPSKIK